MLTVALLQLLSAGTDIATNRERGEDACRRAKDLGADIALFPEMWSVGYEQAIQFDPNPGDLWRSPRCWDESAPSTVNAEHLAAVWGNLAITRDDPFIQHFRTLARELEMAIAITYLEAWSPLPRNSMSLIDRYGEIVLTYAKVHTCDFDVHECSLTPGDGFHVCTLDTAAGPVRIGAMICYDREFPESARVLMLKGAEIILTPNGCTLDSVRLTQFKVRAYENQVGVAMANYAAPQDNGHSCAFDPIVYTAGERIRDSLVVEAGEAEGIVLAPFDLDVLREYRHREAWGNAFRKPSRYSLLVDPEVQEPFIRVNPSGEAYHEVRSRAGLPD
jgi:predicted amidohydrolase